MEDSAPAAAGGFGPEEEAVEASDTTQGTEEENSETDGESGASAETDSAEETTGETDASIVNDDASEEYEPDTVSEEDSGSEEGDTESTEEDATSGEQDAEAENQDAETGEGGGSASSEPGKPTFCAEAVACMVDTCSEEQPIDEACLATCAEGLPVATVSLANSTFECAYSNCGTLCANSDDPGCFTTCRAHGMRRIHAPLLCPRRTGRGILRNGSGVSV